MEERPMTATNINIRYTLDDVTAHRSDDFKRGVIIGMLQALGHSALADKWVEALHREATWGDQAKREEETAAGGTVEALGGSLAVATTETWEAHKTAIAQ